MAQVRFEELIEIAQDRSEGIFQDATRNFMTEYNADFLNIDLNVVTLYGSRNFILIGNDINQLYNSFKRLWQGFLSMNAFNLQRMYDAIKIEYQPLENYDKQSSIKTTYSGKEKETDSNTEIFSSNGSNSENGTNTETGKTETSNNEEFTSGVIGGANVTLTRNNGEQTKTDTESATTYNDSDFENRTKNVAKSNAYVDSETNVSQTNENITNSTASSIDVENNRTIHNIVNNSTALDSSKTVNNISQKEFENRFDEVVEHTHGNIGVTTNTKMLEDELNIRAKTDFYMNMFKRFIYSYSF